MKRIAFIATREPTYSRVSITRRELAKRYQLDEYVSESRHYLIRMVSVTFRLLIGWLSGRLRKSDTVFVGFLAQPVFPLVRLLYRGPIISDAYFSLYDAMVNDKQKVTARSLTGRVCYWLDRHMLKNSDLSFTDTQQHILYMRQQFNVPNANLKRLWISAESQPLKTSLEWHADNSFEVFFWGGFIPLQGVDTIVRAAALLKSDDVNFTIFGSGQTLDACEALAHQLSASNIKFCGWQASEEIPRQAVRSHLALGIFGTTQKALRVIPNKSYEAMAMGIPLISCASPAAEELLTNDVHCMLIEPGNPDALASKIVWARDNYSSAKLMAANAQELFQQSCSPNATATIMFDAIDELMGVKTSAQVKQHAADLLDEATENDKSHQETSIV